MQDIEKIASEMILKKKKINKMNTALNEEVKLY